MFPPNNLDNDVQSGRQDGMYNLEVMPLILLLVKSFSLWSKKPRAIGIRI